MIKKFLIVICILFTGIVFAEEDIFTPEMLEVAPARKVVIIESDPQQEEEIVQEEIVADQKEKTSFTQLNGELGFGLYKIDASLHNKSTSSSYSLAVGMDSNVMWKSQKNKYNNYFSGDYTGNILGFDGKVDLKLAKQGTSLISSDKSYFSIKKNISWQSVDGHEYGAYSSLGLYGQEGTGKDRGTGEFAVGAYTSKSPFLGDSEASIDLSRSNYYSDGIFKIEPSVMFPTNGDKVTSTKYGFSLPWVMGKKSAVLLKPYYFYSKLMDETTEFSFTYDPKVRVATIVDDVMAGPFIQNDTNPDTQRSLIGMSFVLDKKLSSDLVVNGELRLDDINDMIVYQNTDGDDLMEIANVDHAMITSFIVGSEYRYDPKIRFLLKASFNTYSTDDCVPYLPGLNADFKTVYLYDKNTELSAQMDTRTNSKATIAGGNAKGFTVFNLKAERYFSKTFSGYFAIDNLFNNKIEYFKDIEERGMAVKFGAQVTL